MHFSVCAGFSQSWGGFTVVPLIPQALPARDVWISLSLACYLGGVCPSPPAGKLTAFLLWNLTLMLSPGWFIKSQSCRLWKAKVWQNKWQCYPARNVTQTGFDGFWSSPLSHCGEAVTVWMSSWPPENVILSQRNFQLLIIFRLFYRQPAAMLLSCRE